MRIVLGFFLRPGFRCFFGVQDVIIHCSKFVLPLLWVLVVFKGIVTFFTFQPVIACPGIDGIVAIAGDEDVVGAHQDVAEHVAAAGDQQQLFQTADADFDPADGDGLGFTGVVVPGDGRRHRRPIGVEGVLSGSGVHPVAAATGINYIVAAQAFDRVRQIGLCFTSCAECGGDGVVAFGSYDYRHG